MRKKDTHAEDNCPRRPALIIYGSYARIRGQLVIYTDRKVFHVLYTSF